MEKLKEKLSSRKLWAAVAAAVLCVVTAMFGENLTPEVVDITRYAVMAAMVYIFGEGAVDVARQIVAAAHEKYGINDVMQLLADEKTEAKTEETETESAEENKG